MSCCPWRYYDNDDGIYDYNVSDGREIKGREEPRKVTKHVWPSGLRR